jgi:hypothetical protein
MVGYSDGLSGVDAGTEVVYSGENSRYAQLHHHHHQPALRTERMGTLDESIASARDRGDVDLDHRVAGLVGHVDHHHYHHHQHPEHQPTTTETALPSAILKKSIRELKEDTNTHQTQLHPPPPQQQRNTAADATTMVDIRDGSVVARSLIENDADILNYDFGLWEDVEQWAPVHGSTDIDRLHDTLWIK